MQAGTLMHELGHNLGLSHAGSSRTPNCVPIYPSVMNYLYQTRGLTAVADGRSHIDYSSGMLTTLNEASLSETPPPGPTPYRIRYYGPLVGSDPPDSAAVLHCDGTPVTSGVPMIRLKTLRRSLLTGTITECPRRGSLALDVNYDGQTGTFSDFDDWGHLNLQQISARLNVSSLSVDVHLGQTDLGQTDLGQTDLGQTDLGQTDLGQTDLGQTDLGQTDLGQTDLGQTDLGQTDLGQTDLGDEDYITHVLSTIDPPPPPSPDCPTCGLKAASKLDRITLSWTAPGTGQIQSYNIYRSDPLHPIPVLLRNVPGGQPQPTTDDVVDSSATLYNTSYTYYVTSLVLIGSNINESAPSNTATGIVKHLYVAGLNLSRQYGEPNPVLFSVTGLDLPSGGLPDGATCTTTATQTSGFGSYPITCLGPATTSNPYDGITYTSGTLVISPAPLTLTAATNTKTYDGTTTAAALPLVAGLKGSDTVTGLAETYDTKNAGTGKTLSVSAYTVNDGNGGANYVVTLVPNNTGVIKPKPVTAAITAANKIYDTTNSATVTSCALTGVLTGEVGSVTCSGSGATFASANAGTRVVTATVSLSGSGSGNYALSPTTATTMATIFKANATILVTPYHVIHDGAAHTANGTALGVAGEALATLALGGTTHTSVGDYPSDLWTFTDVTGNYNSASGAVDDKIDGFVATGSMGTARSYHTSTLLGNGKVLVTGGLSSSGAPLASGELYDPASGTFTPTANNMPNKAVGQAATLLPNGKVLVTGGGNASSQLYDPAANTWSGAGGMSSQRTYHTATLLPNGKVLIAGGSANNGSTVNSAQIYDPVAGSFSGTGNMTVSRDFHTATLLTSGPNTGKVLIAGGRTSQGKGYTYLSSAELYDPATGVFTAVGGSMTAARFGHTAAVITTGANSGKILIAGGANNAALSTAELYDPATGAFSATGALTSARQYFTATVISTGVLAAGGLNSGGPLAGAERYQNSGFVASDTMKAARAAHTATLLNNGSVLIVGGQNSSGVSTSTAELFRVNP